MANRLQGKACLITGGGSGIGRASCLLFAQEGARVAVADIKPEWGNETVRLIKAARGEAMFAETDVSREPDVARAVRAAVQTYGQLDVLFNVAAIATPRALIEATTEEVWDLMMAVNLKSVFFGMKHAIPAMKQAGGGSIINVTAINVMPGWTSSGAAAYTASKMAILGLTKIAVLECAPYKIRVNCLSPGLVNGDSRLSEAVSAERGQDPEQARREQAKLVKLGRMGKADELARVGLFLASDEASYVTGAHIVADGGTTA